MRGRLSTPADSVPEPDGIAAEQQGKRRLSTPDPVEHATTIIEHMSESRNSDDVLGATASADNPAAKDPSEWVTGDEPMTAPQRSYLDTLAREAGEEISADLTKAEASEHIDRLQDKTGRSGSS
jgi:hypothetical protein